jgi:DNA polymerase-1
MDCLPAIVEMEVMGMPFNTTRAEEVRVQLAKEIFKLENALKIEAATKSKKQQTTLEGGVAGTINLNSPKQIKDYLNSRGHNLESTAKDVLQTIVDPWVDRFLEFRKLERLYKFVETWQEEYVEDGRLYPSYWQAKTRTGRMTSSDPNIQQVPKRERGKELRNIFQAAPGYKIVKSDFAGIELRIMATLTGDKVMLELFKNNADLHKYMAAKVSNKTEDEITKDERTHAKIINFGFIYGMGAPRFKEYALELYRVNLSDEEAQRYRTTFFKAYPEIATWHREEANKLRNNRVVPWKMYTKERGYYDRYLFVTRTLSGRARVFPIVKGKIEAQLPEVLNMPDQGTGADLLKVSLARVYREMVNENVKLIAAVHDEIVLEVREDLAMDAGVQLRRIMVEEGNKMLSPVPVDAEVTVGDSW